MNEPPYIPPMPAGSPSVGPPQDTVGPPQHRPARRRSRTGLGVAGAIVAASVVGFGCGYGASFPHSGDVSASSAGQAGSAGSGLGGSAVRNGASRTATHPATTSQARGIVDITTVLKYQGARAAGTGMILTSSGEILTNNHVVEGSTSIRARVPATGQTYKARVIGTDKNDDVAVLKLKHASGLSTVETDDAGISIGDKVVGIGNAGGTGSLTAARGRVIAKHQHITTQSEGVADSEHLNGLIRTSADVRSGDSGGPLETADGDVVGMDTAAAKSDSTGATTSGYAIPIDSALHIAATIDSGQETKNVAIGYPAFLGIELNRSPVTQTNSGENREDGARVSGVVSGTPAASAGLVAGDVITAVDHHRVDSSGRLSDVLDGYDPGQSATIHWTDRAGGTHSSTVTFAEGPVE